MSSASVTFLVVRVLHVLLAAVLVGTSTFIYLFLEPILGETSPAVAGAFLAALKRRGMQAFMPSVGGITVLTGIWLYWHFTGHFDPAQSGTMAARVFGAGGVAGILAVIIGSSVAGRNARKMTALAEQAMVLPDGAERDIVLAQASAARHRAAIGGRITLALLFIALISMAVGHYF